MAKMTGRWRSPQPPVADGTFRLREREHLGVRRSVLQRLHLVEGPRNDPALAHNNRPDGCLLRFISSSRLPQRFAHKVMVALQINDGVVHP